METLAADLRFAVRMLVKNRWFTAVAVITLALGIGANTAIFTVVDAVMLKPLPYAEADRMVRLERQYPNGYGDSNSIPKFMTWHANNHVFSAMALYDFNAPVMTLGTSDPPRQVHGLQVSSEYFRVFGVAPILGRTFTAAEDLPGGTKTAVLSYGLWQSDFSGDRGVLGRSTILDGAPYTIIGVLPRGFHSENEADLWTALQADPDSTNQGHYLTASARLKPGVTLSAARADMKLAGERFRERYPKWMDKTESVGVVPLQDATVRDVKLSLWVLTGAVGFVLLIACANVANLLLARASSRQREMAVRAAIGASRTRVLRQLLTESVLLASLGGILGFGLGAWGVRMLLHLVPGNIPRLMSADGLQAVAPPIDWPVAVFTLGVAMITGVLFGLFPAWHASNPDLASSLKEASGRSGTGKRHNVARSILVVSEVSLALVLLVSAALLIRTFVGLSTVNPGFDSTHILTAETAMGAGAYNSTAKVDDFVRRVTEQMQRTPGVEVAASAIVLPATAGIDLPFNIIGKAPARGNEYNGDEQWRSVSEHYFDVFRIPLIRGRVFRATDTGGSPPVVVINANMAHTYWKNEDPVGQTIVIGKGLGPQFDDRPRQIVGVVGTVREAGISRGETGVMYVPQSQVPEGLTSLANSVLPLNWAVRTAGDPLHMRMALEKSFRAIDATMVPTHERSMEQVVSKSVARQNFNMLLLVIFAGVALLLAAIGIYGLMAYAVEQRTQEIGIRMALGAGSSQMLRMMLSQGMRLTGIGVVIGLGLAWAMTRFLGSLLFGVKATDPVAFGGVALLLTLVAFGATLIPARRAAQTEPDKALRY
ncbi:MAG TPA: ABC transporter permease [Verrucomicrobiae bacterium]|nr:ABC transporter permease [Verrucomicrobiae bacterium]